jgi:hypothetical protein
MTEVNARRVMFVSFRESEATHWERFLKDEPALAKSFSSHDAVCFVNLARDMNYFVYGDMEIDNGAGGKVKILVSHKGRVHGGKGSWTGKMLANYAAALGLKLVGRKRYEEAYEEAEEEKRRVIAAARRAKQRS